jgi:hypothetical protein
MTAGNRRHHSVATKIYIKLLLLSVVRRDQDKGVSSKYAFFTHSITFPAQQYQSMIKIFLKIQMCFAYNNNYLQLNNK